VPDAALGELSFDALLFDNATGKSPDALPFLIRAHNFSYTYSAALLRQLEGGSHDNVQTGLICFAPNFDAPTDASEPAIRSAELGPLLFNQDEAQQITKITTGKLYAGVDATRTKFEQVADQAQVLHLSSHAVANNDLGENSFLAFAPQPDGGDLLFVRDLYGMSIPVEMVVLSACKTASGEIRKGEGIVSLARGFFYAGTRSLVSTLWNLNDQAGSKLMVAFYAGLKNHLRKDEALRNAKLRFLAEATDAEELHPYYWAGVICMGNTDAFNIGKSARTSHYLLWAGLALMTLFLIRKFLVSPP